MSSELVSLFFDSFLETLLMVGLSGLIGALLGIPLGRRMAGAKDHLTKLFALVVILTGLYVTASGWPALSALATAG